MDSPFTPPREGSSRGLWRILKEGLTELREAARPADYWVAVHRNISYSPVDGKALRFEFCVPVVRDGRGSPNAWPLFPLFLGDGFHHATEEVMLILLDEDSSRMASWMRYPYIVCSKSQGFRGKNDRDTFVMFEGSPYHVLACLRTDEEHSVSYHWSPVTNLHDRYFASRSRATVKEWLRKQQ